MASTDELFPELYANPKKNIDDCITFILNEVMRQGINGYHDDEIYSMAMHYYDEEDIEVGKPTDCRVVVNHLVELTEEEKQEARQKALRQYQDEELRKMQNRQRARAAKPQKPQVEPSLFDKLWIAAEVILFVLVGAAVDIRYMAKAGAMALLMIGAALLFRAVGVCICMLGTKLTWKERLFCIIAYLPKATVQAAIGSVPLAAGLSCGTLVLSVAVMAIVITAPIGALSIDSTYKHLLEK